MLLADERFASRWRGNRAPLKGRADSHYEIACKTKSYVEEINLGKDRFIVLGDEPMMTEAYEFDETEECDVFCEIVGMSYGATNF